MHLPSGGPANRPSTSAIRQPPRAPPPAGSPPSRELVQFALRERALTLRVIVQEPVVFHQREERGLGVVQSDDPLRQLFHERQLPLFAWPSNGRGNVNVNSGLLGSVNLRV